MGLKYFPFISGAAALALLLTLIFTSSSDTKQDTEKGVVKSDTTQSVKKEPSSVLQTVKLPATVDAVVEVKE